MTEFIEIQEGKAKILVDKTSFEEDPTHSEVFYNPVMEFDRNISVDILRAYFGDSAYGCDLLAATGVRGIRYMLEGGFSVCFNDISPKATELIKKNLSLNGLEAPVFTMDANKFLYSSEERYDFIDIDPFGSPSYFIEAAVCRLKKDGLLMITATDVGTLAGCFPKPCLRKYGIITGKTSFDKEFGLRVLLASVFLKIMKYEAAIEPLFSYYHRHYYRAYLIIRRGNKYVNRGMEKLGFVEYDPATDEREVYSLWNPCGFGPIWLGELWDRNLVKKTDNSFVSSVCSELDTLFYFNLSYLYKIMKKSARKISELSQTLREKGYSVSRTHFFSQAIKTNCPLNELKECL